ncbi:MAG TPA: prepilin-type N-terminal cleavage/methylation domain-containing protein [Sedimentisphaerales bacterium]|nr:prepilin-type N-terminal cleavage/methylation domain-containing protein [Sedimentisphaerales bacterium]
MRRVCIKESGFTLVEVVAASVIGAFIALVAVGTLRSITAGTDRIDNVVRAAAEARFARDMIYRDLSNLYRDSDIEKMRLIGETAGSVDGVFSWLTFYTVGRSKARVEQPEGDVYEVEYYLSRDGDRSELMRRLWPNPDKDVEPGGILTVIAEDIEFFEVRFFDGEEWQEEWPEEMKSIPHLVEVALGARQKRGQDIAVETFIVNFVRPSWVEQNEGEGEEGTAEERSGRSEERPAERTNEREGESSEK